MASNRSKIAGMMTVRWGFAVGACAVLMAALGCDSPDSASASVKPLKADAYVSPQEILTAYRSCLATVQTTWRERSSILSGYKTYGYEGVGVIVASDGRTALLLTSRRMVDPSYHHDGAARRDVAFRVSVPGTDTPGAGANARLVALYLNDADLALVRIGAPSPKRFAIPLAGPEKPRVGDDVAVVGPPFNLGLVVGSGMINNYWQDMRLGTSTLQVRLTDGSPVTAGGVFTRQGGRLVGILRGQERAPAGVEGDLFALSTEALRMPDYWTYLVEEGQTRRLLGMIK